MTRMVSESPQSLAVFEHQKRREWGLGVLAWESKNRRGYVFENGQVRVLAEPFYAMMRQVERPVDELRELFRCLKPELDAARAEQSSVLHAPRPAAATMTFDDQLMVFRAAFAGGFSDPRWLEQQRGENAKKRQSGHRDAAIAEAQEKLSARSLKARLAEQAFQSVHEDVWSVLEATDLVPRVELAVLAGADPARQRAVASMVAELLHGKGTFGPRFDHFLAAFQSAVKKPAGWQLATTLVALAEPREHVSVRPTAFRAQAKLLAPHLAIPKLPNAASYMRCLAMAKLISTKLTEHGQSPRDLLDVLDFMRITTGPDARKRLSDIKRSVA